MTEPILRRGGNWCMTLLLRSPLHGLISGHTLLITVTGRRSGWRYTLPVNYARLGDVLTITSQKGRTWWRNLRGGAPVQLWLQGREISAWAEVFEDEPAVAAGLEEYLRALPHHAPYFAVRLDAGDQPQFDPDVVRAARSRVVIRVELGAQTGAAFLEVWGRGFDDDVIALLCRRPEVWTATGGEDWLRVRLTRAVNVAPLLTLLIEAGAEIEEARKGGLGRDLWLTPPEAATRSAAPPGQTR